VVGTLLSTSSSAGIDLLALRELMGHANPETTAAYVHLSPQTLAAEYARARAAR
jgi:integrase/recombinase XerC